MSDKPVRVRPSVAQAPDVYAQTDYQASKANLGGANVYFRLGCPNAMLHSTAKSCDFCGWGTDKKKLI